LVLTAVRIQAM